MDIQHMFEKDINRPINGVVQVGQDDEDSLRQELGEYIVTRELRGHFMTFLSNYSDAIARPTNDIGVWISGFFGSGKSHFLKILSYLLSNKAVGGERPVDLFKDKFDDPMLYASLVRCAAIPTESILFNIDVEAPQKKDSTVVLRIFAKMFYNHLGYYGTNLKTVALEKFIESEGRTEAFRVAFEIKNGRPWQEKRKAMGFLQDDVVYALTEALNMSEASARAWFANKAEPDISIKALVEDIKDYVDKKGKDFRLLFCVDEAGQYIGEDGSLLLNLQTIAEQIGSQCRGKVWVMVTSQEAIDEIVKISADDFSKIQARFTTRLSLGSQSVDEVIKKRILEKTEDADRLLRLVYDKEHAVLKNLFAFNNAMLDIKGYTDAGEFSATYPFVPYQFLIIQKVLSEIRKFGNSGKHLSGGERSMLSGFQEAAQKAQHKDENALVPFYLFYDTVHTFLQSVIRRVIDRCQNAADQHNGLEQQDVSVLKLLYLIRYIDDIKSNIDNIAILMVDDIRTDKINLRKAIAASLDRLVSQNYVARSGDNYTFLTDEEQDVAIDIRNTQVDSAAIVSGIAQIIFADIYPSKKFKYKSYDFSYDQYVDEMRFGSASGGVGLRFVTVASDYYNAPRAKLVMDSQVNNEAIVLLSNETPYFEDLEEAAKINKYANLKMKQSLPESLQAIIRGRREQGRLLEKSAKDQIEKAIVNGTYFIHGEVVPMKSGDSKNKLDAALAQLIETVYYKLDNVNVFCESDADVLRVLNGGAGLDGIPGSGANNEFALSEVSQWLELQANNHIPVSMGDVQRRYQAIPYGWREVDIAALVARLIAAQKITIKYGGAVVTKDDQKLVGYLRKRSEIDKVGVTRRIAPSEELMRKSVAFLRDWLGQMDIPSDEDGLVGFVKNTLKVKESYCDNLIENEYKRDRYPEEDTVTATRDLMKDVLSQERDNVALLYRLIAKQDDLRESTEDMEAVDIFFHPKSQQKAIFDAARALEKEIQNERDYFAADTETNGKIGEIKAILAMPKPYGKIKDLSDLMQGVRKARAALLEQKKEEVRGMIVQCMGDVHTLADMRYASAAVKKADERFTEYKEEAADATSLTLLDAMITRLLNYKDTVCKQIEALQRPEPDKPHIGPVPQPPKVVQLRRYDVFPAKRLQSRSDVDSYVKGIKQKLYDVLESNDGIQIN